MVEKLKKTYFADMKSFESHISLMTDFGYKDCVFHEKDMTKECFNEISAKYQVIPEENGYYTVNFKTEE